MTTKVNPKVLAQKEGLVCLAWDAIPKQFLQTYELVREIAQWVKCLLGKHEDQSSKSPRTRIRTGGSMHLQPQFWRTETWVPGVHWPASQFSCNSEI